MWGGIWDSMYTQIHRVGKRMIMVCNITHFYHKVLHESSHLPFNPNALPIKALMFGFNIHPDSSYNFIFIVSERPLLSCSYIGFIWKILFEYPVMPLLVQVFSFVTIFYTPCYLSCDSFVFSSTVSLTSVFLSYCNEFLFPLLSLT